MGAGKTVQGEQGGQCWGEQGGQCRGSREDGAGVSREDGAGRVFPLCVQSTELLEIHMAGEWTMLVRCKDPHSQGTGEKAI